MKLNKMISLLYRLARGLTDFKAISSGSPMKIGRRVKNKFIGRKIIKKLWWSGEENKNLHKKVFSYRIGIDNKKLNIVNKKLTLSNLYSADGAVRLVSIVLMVLLGVRTKIS